MKLHFGDFFRVLFFYSPNADSEQSRADSESSRIVSKVTSIALGIISCGSNLALGAAHGIRALWNRVVKLEDRKVKLEEDQALAIEQMKNKFEIEYKKFEAEILKSSRELSTGTYAELIQIEENLRFFKFQYKDVPEVEEKYKILRDRVEELRLKHRQQVNENNDQERRIKINMDLNRNFDDIQKEINLLKEFSDADLQSKSNEIARLNTRVTCLSQVDEIDPKEITQETITKRNSLREQISELTEKISEKKEVSGEKEEID